MNASKEGAFFHEFVGEGHELAFSSWGASQLHFMQGSHSVGTVECLFKLDSHQDRQVKFMQIDASEFVNQIGV